MNTIEWLLSDSNLSVKYWTLRDVLEKPEESEDIQKARNLIPQQDIIKKIFSFQDEAGFWGSSTRLWSYKNTVFQLLLLSELGCRRVPRIEKAVECVFDFQLDDGSFSSVLGKTKKHSTSEFCLTAIILKVLLLFGYERDLRVEEALNFLVSTEDNGWCCSWYPMEKEKVIPEKCYMGGVKGLAALAKLPSHMVTPEIRAMIASLAEVYLENRIYWYRKDKHGNRAKKPSWTHFAFPLFWQSDALEVLDVLTELKIRDDRMQEALELVKSKCSEGKWILERTFPKRHIVTIEKVGRPSKWITLKALRVLKRAGYWDDVIR